MIYDVDMSKGKLTYQGVHVEAENLRWRKIGSGAYGDVIAVAFKDPLEPSVTHQIAVKVPTQTNGVSSAALEEIEVAGAYSRIYECAHLIPIAVTRDRTIVMPLTDGYLTKVRACTVPRAHRICAVLLEALRCLAYRDSPVYYLDLKPQNVLYVDKGKDAPDVLLGDLGSIIPLHGRYAATHPYPL